MIPSPLQKEVFAVGKHSLIYMAGQALSRAVGFFMIPIYTRFIAPTHYGAMELIEIIASAAAMVVSMGIAEGMARFYYAEKEEEKRKQVVSTIIIGCGVAGLPIVLGFVAISGFMADFIFEEATYRFYIQIALATVWFGMLCEIGYTYLRMMYMAKKFVVLTIIQVFIALSLNIYLVAFKRMDILGIFYSSLITEGLIGIILAITILKKVRYHLSLSILWSMIKFGLPLVPSRIGLMLGFVSNRFFLRWLGSPDPTMALAQIGLFSLGHKFGVIINRFVTVPFNSFWSPRRMELLLGEESEAQKTIARVCTYATLGSIFVGLIISSGIENLIEIMAAPGYKGAYLVVPFVALSYIALGLDTHFATGIFYRKKTQWSTYITLLSLGVVLLWNYIFVPRYGLIGAATSNLAGFVVRISLTYSISQRILYIPFEIKRLGKMMGLAFALYFISQGIAFKSPYLTFMARTGIASTFPLLLFFTRFYTTGELAFIRKIIRKILRANET